MSTKIEWCRSSDGTKGETWNPVTGCTPVSSGCLHCYARRMSKRLAGRFGYPADEPFRVTYHGYSDPKLEQPLRWSKPRRIFACSMGDMFHKDVLQTWLDDIFVIMLLAWKHTFLLLTKRPEMMRAYLTERYAQERVHGQASEYGRAIEHYWSKSQLLTCYATPGDVYEQQRAVWPPPNIHLGVSVEDQATADERIPVLLQTPAARRFVSIEPLLAPVNLHAWLCQHSNPERPECRMSRWCSPSGHLNQVIVGEETGPGARPCDPDWMRSLRDQCAAAQVPFFLKKIGGSRELDGRRHEEVPR